MSCLCKTQTLLPSNVAIIEISPQGLKFCNFVEKCQILLDGNNVWILHEPLTHVAIGCFENNSCNFDILQIELHNYYHDL